MDRAELIEKYYVKIQSEQDVLSPFPDEMSGPFVHTDPFVNNDAAMYRIEEELMHQGWTFGERHDVFIAYHSPTMRMHRGHERAQVIVEAWLDVPSSES